ncbi:lipid-A-disaccharide synthase [Pseudohoeflea suaedae]|uniref:Lipid-A-disaccharide synthase n=1 Tax=Pseudohoeflea suaedae TaxID=877384 RepID=A0A4R5PLH5_9HYPH|nr:lipid-A-disaccharide synthase [Pseudohoeflea suaedae]TDH36188.1 lipid-A-disaccharide synthase [Pseudohoeflea suaedae]
MIGRLAIIAGEHSGDLLGAGLVRALGEKQGHAPELFGVGGPALEAEGLDSLFDYSELSLMGISAVLAKLPSLIRRIRQTADAIIAERPDCLVIVDSPDFTHRVARRVRNALPDLPIINYVCPTVWAWKPGRARAMTGYIDHVLGVFPFEPEVVMELGGPPLTYVGHRLTGLPGLQAARDAQMKRHGSFPGKETPATCLLLPGSRRGEISRLADDIGRSAEVLKERLGAYVRFVLPVAPGREEMIAETTARWSFEVETVVGDDAKWDAFGKADVAIAASGTVLLELALAGIPAISLYRLDFIASQIAPHVIKTWSAALPNLIADRVIVHEYLQDQIRPERIGRLAWQLVTDERTRAAVLADLDIVYREMAVERPPEENAAETVLAVVDQLKNP